jgi:hypothetical protein
MPKPAKSAASVAAAGLMVIAAAVLAGCGLAGASGAAQGSAGSHGPTRQSDSSTPRPDQSGAGQSGAGQSGAGQSGAGQSGAGQSRAGQSSAVAGSALLCADPAAVTRLRVVRIPSRSQLGQAKPMPRQSLGVTVRDPAAARTLARAVCGLPAMPTSALHCPVDVGGGYVLEFMSGVPQFRPVIIRASGCEEVTGLGAGGARWVAKTPRFWTMLAQLTGIRAPWHSP